MTLSELQSFFGRPLAEALRACDAEATVTLHNISRAVYRAAVCGAPGKLLDSMEDTGMSSGWYVVRAREAAGDTALEIARFLQPGEERGALS